MSHRWKLIAIYGGITLVAFLIFMGMMNAAQPAIAKGTPGDVQPAGWIVLVGSILTALSTGGLTLKNLLGAFEDWMKGHVTAEQSQQIGQAIQSLKAIVDPTPDKMFANLYNNEKDPVIKGKIKDLWKESSLARIERDVPAPPSNGQTDPIPPADAATIAQMRAQLSSIQAASYAGASTLK